MLNYNKIESCINFDRTPYRKLAEFMGLADSTLRSRMKLRNITPDDVEKIADFFAKPISYFFDREEVEQKHHKPIPEKQQIVEDPEPCRDCESLRDKVKLLEKINLLQEEKIARFEGVVEKREGATQNSAQAG